MPQREKERKEASGLPEEVKLTADLEEGDFSRYDLVTDNFGLLLFDGFKDTFLVNQLSTTCFTDKQIIAVAFTS
ncbi:hypothetical protein J6590_038700 [Homalodisca vitripennis]|nr:hypothetical protein J6590_038700 [Homalodisca vitripennis]